MRHFRVNTFSSEKPICFIDYECRYVALCSLGFPVCYAPYCIVFCGLSSFAFFSTLPQKRPAFRKNVTEPKMCVSIFSATSI